jgi:hypothetical protein
MATMRDGRDPHRDVEFFERDMAVRLAERAFRLEVFGVEHAFDHDFCFGRHQQIDRFAAHNADRLAGKPARNADFVKIERQLHRRHIGNARRAAKRDRTGHLPLAATLMLQVVPIAARAADTRCHADHHAIRGLESGAVGAVVLHASLRIARDHVGRGQRRRAIESRGGNRYRQRIEPVALPFECLARDHHFLARSARHGTRRNGIGEGAVPARLDLCYRGAHADAVDRSIAGKRAHHHRKLVLAAAPVCDISK